MSGIFLGIGLEFVDTIFQTIKNSDFSQYTIVGMKTLALYLGINPCGTGKELYHSDFGHFFHTGIKRFRHHFGGH